MLPLYAVLQSCQALQDQMLAAPTDELRQQQGRVAEIFGSRLRRAIEEASQAGQQHRAGGASSEIGLFLGQVKQNGLLAAALLRMTGHDRLGLSAANRRWLTEALCSESILTKKPGETAVDPDQVSVPLLGIYVSKARKAIEFWPGGDWAFYLEARTCLRGEAPSIRSKYQCLMDDPTSQRTPPGTESRRPGAEGYEVVFHKDSGERFEEQGQMSKSLLELTWAEHAGETFELLPSKKKAG
jgi:hypothetical protein